MEGSHSILNEKPPSEVPRSLDLLALCACLGMIAGIVEGAALYGLQHTRFSGETINMLLVPRGILYLSPLEDLLLFVFLGFLAAGICRAARGRVPGQFILWLLLTALVFDWLAIALDLVMDPPYIAILSAGISAALARKYWKEREALLRSARRALPVLACGVAVLAASVTVVNRRAAAADAAANAPAPAQDSPNILIVVMDTVRADHISSLGYARATTPVLDGLAAEGVLFENAFSTSSWTLPAHASLLTGRFPFEHGAEVKAYDGRYATLPEAFRARGYRTGAFSANTYYFATQNGFGRGFTRFDGMFTSVADALMRPLYGRYLMIVEQMATRSDLPGRKRADLVNERFLEWLEGDSKRPFLAVLNYFDAHDPYLPPEPFRARFSGRADVGGLLNGWGERENLERPGDVLDEKAAYDGGIAYEDDRIGGLLGELKERGLARNLIVVVVSDHGEFFGEHGLYLHKNALFLEGIHVPLLMTWPGHIPGGMRVTRPVSIASVPATLAALVPGMGEAEFPGPSLAPLWSELPKASPGDLILSELVGTQPLAGRKELPRWESLLNARWHFIYNREKGGKLFEWKKDPREEKNVAETEEGRQVVSGMMGCLDRHLSGIRLPSCGLGAPALETAPARVATPVTSLPGGSAGDEP